ncbi:SRPBCC family protein [Marinobacter alexandrii]|uniref:SRPBCC family protein n=1 Tax=Marinobacter alexandrii TaxID=2570351 RepID=UPI001107D2F6|nr:SRPBCC family protein [Marinobacter alexandrii]
MGTCYNKIEINSSADKVWNTVSNFHDMSWAPDVIASLSKVGEKGGHEVGAKRVLNEAIHETLIEIDPQRRTFSYSIDDGPGPVSKDAVSNYKGVVKVTESDNGCLVEWSSTFESENDNEVSEFCDPIYMALLNALKKAAEH